MGLNFKIRYTHFDMAHRDIYYIPIWAKVYLKGSIWPSQKSKKAPNCISDYEFNNLSHHFGACRRGAKLYLLSQFYQFGPMLKKIGVLNCISWIKKEVIKVSFYIVPHLEEFKNLSLHDCKAVLKYGRLARKIEKQLARKRRYAQWMKTKGGN